MQIVSITTNILVRGMGIPYGRKHIRDAFVLRWKPIIIVHDKKGINIPKIIKSCVVGINECGKRPTKFVGLINKHYKYFCSGLPFIVMNGHYLFCRKLNQSLLNRNHAVIHESSVGKLSLYFLPFFLIEDQASNSRAGAVTPALGSQCRPVCPFLTKSMQGIF